MKKKSLTKLSSSIIIVLFVLMNIVSSTTINVSNSGPLTSDGNILYVGGNGPGNYTTIQGAIDDAAYGDTVFVYDDSSPYIENLQINNSISLIGEDRNTTIVDGIGDFEIIVTSDNVNFSGLTIKDNMLKLFNFYYTNIFNNIFFNCDYGILAYTSYLKNCSFYTL